MSRELKRGRVVLKDSEWREYESYSADVSQDDYDRKATYKGPGLKIGNDHALSKHIEDKILKEKYSPDAVIMEIESGKYEFETTLCTRTVYNYINQGIFVNITNKDLLRKGKSQKRKYKRVRKAFKNVGGKSISQRPEEANERLEYGHWEMDCVESGKRTAIYYCHPYSSWERGSNEQRNGHIRRFIPKGSDISKYTNKRIKEIENWLNSYPRRVLKGLSAIEVLEELKLAS